MMMLGLFRIALSISRLHYRQKKNRAEIGTMHLYCCTVMYCTVHIEGHYWLLIEEAPLHASSAVELLYCMVVALEEDIIHPL